MAQTIGVSASTLCRELKRNSGKRCYHYQQAQVKAADRQRRLQNYRNSTIGIRNFIRAKMAEGSGLLNRFQVTFVRKETKCLCGNHICYIRADRKNGGDLWTHCRHQLKHHKCQMTAPYTEVQNRTMIDGRPFTLTGRICVHYHFPNK